MSANDRESPLARWSRRKAEARRQDRAAPPPVAADAPLEPAAGTSGPPAETAPLTDADMPAIESLTTESDFSPFMSTGVSDALRNRALRKLFSAPAFNLRDGLDDYDEEFTSFAQLGETVTADMKHRVAMEQEKLRERLAGRTGEPRAADGPAPAEAPANADEANADPAVAESAATPEAPAGPAAADDGGATTLARGEERSADG